MPIFHDPQESLPKWPSSRQVSRAGLVEADTPGNVHKEQTPDLWQSESAPGSVMPLESASDSPSEALKPSIVGRLELIDRLKRTKSPTWSQRHSVSNCRS